MHVYIAMLLIYLHLLVKCYMYLKGGKGLRCAQLCINVYTDACIQLNSATTITLFRYVHGSLIVYTRIDMFVSSLGLVKFLGRFIFVLKDVYHLDGESYR